ncbi:unnamed protein product [Nezara viridula]|uniref:Uncharacterized protein n=1 Tax=Nezara viridula TaxID=85310 RepID=A0A9P0MSL3_NEZVI|nr:unnamed protein product [Nezara viridula]
MCWVSNEFYGKVNCWQYSTNRLRPGSVMEFPLGGDPTCLPFAARFFNLVNIFSRSIFGGRTEEFAVIQGPQVIETTGNIEQELGCDVINNRGAVKVDPERMVIAGEMTHKSTSWALTAPNRPITPPDWSDLRVVGDGASFGLAGPLNQRHLVQPSCN